MDLVEERAAMQNYVKKFIEEAITWAVPVICAGILMFWKKVPEEYQHYWPVLLVFIQGLHALILSYQNRRDIKNLRQLHATADRKENDRKAIDASIARAFRAILDDDMGKLYETCIARGYTTEDERRRYLRLHAAYEGIGGNGEAQRRKTHFEAIQDEELWKANHKERMIQT